MSYVAVSELVANTSIGIKLGKRLPVVKDIFLREKRRNASDLEG